MRTRFRRCSWTVLPIAFLLFGMSGATVLKAGQAQDRIRTAIDDRAAVTVRGNIRPEVSRATALGAPEQDLPMRHMILLLKPDAAQEAALEKLIEQQQDPHSPLYHQFLTPQAYGQQFGASANDIAKVTGWLTDHGFAVEQVTPGHRSIVFSGTASEVMATFGTPIRKLISDGEVHYANTAEPRIPAALSSVVAGVVKLNDFHHKPAIQRLKPLAKDAASAPQFTYGSSHYLSPADYATIYNLSPLYANQIDGAGQSIAIVGRSNVSMSDVQTFRAQFGLPANDPTVIVASGNDPGFVPGDGDEATLDVEWSGAIAPKASVKLVVASSTATADGVDLAAQYIVNRNLAPVMSVSFGACEASMGSTGVAFYNSLWQQAAAQGITVLISSGDSGAAGCSWGGSSSGSVRGVNGLCSSPYDVCVGGTQFAEGSNPGQYWLPGNNPVMGSAQSYIPEAVWNESGSNGGSGLWAGGGGASIFFAKPVWQSGVGVPADGARDVPDVSLTAAGHDGYLIQENGGLYVIAGTSASSPAFAGMMTLLNQKMGSRLGNPNATLYKLASYQAAGGAKVFHDTTAGSNAVPGVAGFSATTGYDLASGLGSVDASSLVNHWTDAAAASSLSVAITPSTLTIAPGASTSFTTQVIPPGTFKSAVTLAVSGAPAGVTVSLSSSTIASPGSGSVTATVVAAKTAPVGTYTITVTATGGNLTAKATTLLTVTSPNFSFTGSTDKVSLTPGANAAIAVSIAPQSGFSSTVNLTIGGLPAGFKSSFAPPSFNGSVNATSTLTLTAAPSATQGTYPVTITATGGGLTKTLQLSVTVTAPPSFTLTSSGATGNVTPGRTAAATIWVTPSSGFKSTISLSASGLPAGLTSSFAPPSLNGSTTANSTLTLTAGQTAKPGTYAFTIIATGGGITKTLPLAITINAAPTFTLTPYATSITLVPWVPTATTVMVATNSTFAAAITLSATLPAGVQASFSPSTLPAPGNGTALITFSASSGVKPGTYTATITATGGGVTRTATVQLNVQPTPAFALALDKQFINVPPGASLPIKMSLVGTSGGFNTPIMLLVAGSQAGIGVNFAPSTLTLTNPTSTITISVASNARPGIYTIALAGTTNRASQTLLLSVTIPQPGQTKH